MSSLSIQLWKACAVGNVSLVKSCIEAGDNINFQYHDGMTPLLAACMNNQVEVVREILATESVVVAAVNNKGMTALHLACLHGWVECIRAVGMDRRMTPDKVNRKNEDGRTALMEAVQAGKIESIKEMENIEGVDWETENQEGESLEEVARNEHLDEVLNYLEERNNQTGDEENIFVPEESDQYSVDEITHSHAIRDELHIEQDLADNVQSDVPYPLESDLLSNDNGSELSELDITEPEKISHVEESDISEIIEELESLNRLIVIEREVFEEKQMKDKDNFEQGQTDEKRIFEYKEELNKSRKRELERSLESKLPTTTPTANNDLFPECPVCYEYLTPPLQIYSCENGHLVCQDCKPKLSKCILCRGTLVGRATAMEQLLIKLDSAFKKTKI